MNNSNNTICFNLYNLYDILSKNVEKIRIVRNAQFRIINSPSYAWPNMVYSVSNDLKEDGFIRLINELDSIRERLILISTCEEEIFFFQKQGFLLLDRWLGMTFEISEQIDCSMDSSEIYFEQVEDKNIKEWVSKVSEFLFGGAMLDLNIFIFLKSAGSKLISLKKGHDIIGTSMTYRDVNGYTGIYMVAIDKNQRGKGYAKKLMNFTLNEIYSAEKRNVVLQSTWMGIPLYRSIGFTDGVKINLLAKK